MSGNKTISKIIVVCCSLFILLLGGCLLYKNPEIELVKLEQNLEKIGFKENNTHQYELIKEGLSQENYLKSNDSTKKTNSIIFDTSTSIITLNEEFTENNDASSVSLNLDLKTLIIKGYYSFNSDFVPINYDLKSGSYECENSSECNSIYNKVLNFIDEVNDILNECHKNINDFKK